MLHKVVKIQAGKRFIRVRLHSIDGRIFSGRSARQAAADQLAYLERRRRSYSETRSLMHRDAGAKDL